MDSADLTLVNATAVIDARWTPCPGPLLEAKKGISHLSAGEVLEIHSHDPVARTDIAAWAGKAGHEFLGFLCFDGYDRIFLRKRSL